MVRIQSHLRIHPKVFSSLQDEADRLGLNVDQVANNILAKSLSVSLEVSTIEDQIIFESLTDHEGLRGKNFTDEGAKAYSAAARYEFLKHSSLKSISLPKAIAEISAIAIKHEGNVELIGQILMGLHVLTGEEIVKAIRNGNCPMQKTLQEWSGEPLHSLCKVFVDAIEI